MAQRTVNPISVQVTSNGTTYTATWDPTTGDVEISKPAGGRAANIIIVKNGVLVRGGQDDEAIFKDGEVTAQFKNSYAEMITKIHGAFKNLGGNASTYKLNSSATPEAKNSLIIGDTTSGLENIATNTVQGIGDLLNELTEFAKNPNIEDYGTDMAQLFVEDNGVLRYPLDIAKNAQDTLVITQYTYKSPYFEMFDETYSKSVAKNGAQRTSALKKRIASLILPIPNNVADSNGTNWGDGNTMNTMHMSAAGDITKIATMLGSQTLAGFVGDKLIGKFPIAGGILTGLSKFPPDLLYAALSDNWNNPTFRKSIESLLLKKVGFDIPPEEILSRGYGVVPNSNLELLFNGPTLRGFQFGYTFTPRSEREALQCRKILRFFKQGMAPKKKRSSGGYGGASYLLATPNVFKLNYRTVGKNGPKDIEGLNKFKICALTNINTSYSDGAWAAYEEGQPVRMQLNLSFKELEPVYESDYQYQASSNYLDGLKAENNQYLSIEERKQDSVSPTEIGY